MKYIEEYCCAKCCADFEGYYFINYAFFKKCGICGKRYFIINKISYYELGRKDIEEKLEELGGVSSVARGESRQ